MRETHGMGTAEAGISGFDADDPIGRGGNSDRTARVGAETPIDDPCRYGRSRAARGSPGYVRRIPGIVAVTPDRVVPCRTQRELIHHERAEIDRPRSLESHQ